MQTRFALILYFCMVAHKLHAIVYQRHFKISEDMVQILLMLEIFSYRILKVKICSVVLLLALNPACSSAIISLA